jgi:anti-sigma28 factor (negative regulator of flagellin synthesis)
MKIPSSSSIQKIGPAEAVKPAVRPALGGTTGETAARPAGPARSDSVQISAAGRALQETVGKVDGEGLTPERVSEIRQRILAGAYNSTAIVDQVARSILDRGDV